MIIGFDALYGTLAFEDSEVRLLQDLLACPEVLRLRKMRLLNFDSILFQDLSSANRLSHSLGVAYIASSLRGFARSSNEALEWIAAALLHDIGILPFGHLVESYLSERQGGFSHEALVKKILFGTYHSTNIYHQILPGQSLKLSSVLKKHGLNIERIVGLISPGANSVSIFNGPIDLDNIDNIHRMALLLGCEGVKRNLCAILGGLRVNEGCLIVTKETESALRNMLRYREQIYGSMIAHPAAVPYNCLLSDLANEAVEAEIITPNEWFLSDSDFKQKIGILRKISVAAEAYSSERCYTLKDYIWIRASQSEIGRLTEIANQVPQVVVQPGFELFVWKEKGKIERKLNLRVSSGSILEIGEDMASVLISVVDKRRENLRGIVFELPKPLITWRRKVVKAIDHVFKGVPYSAIFPEDFESSKLSLSQTNENQLQLFHE